MQQIYHLFLCQNKALLIKGLRLQQTAPRITWVYMIKLNEKQVFTIIDRYYPASKDIAVNHAIINVMLNNMTIYRAEKDGNLNNATLRKRVNKIKNEIRFIEKLIN